MGMGLIVYSINDPEEIEKELDILETLRRKDRHNHFNVIHMKEHFVFRGHTCITFELLG